MRKLFVLSYDDGTVHDEKMIEILNKHNVPATFNLNSGLKDFVWYTNNKAIHRLDLTIHKDLYHGHEVAVHTVTHPYLTEIDDETLYSEVVEDQKALSDIFGYNVIGMGVPFDQCNDLIIEKIRSFKVIKYLRVPTRSHTFNIPNDPMKIPITTEHTNPLADNLIEKYINAKCGDDLMIFVLAGHAYDFFVNDNWSWLEKTIVKLKADEKIDFVTLRQAVHIIFGT